MQIDVKKKRDNVLMDRTDVWFTATHEGEKTPTRDQLKKALATNLGSKPELTIVESVDSEFGIGRSKGFAKVYKNLEQARKSEPAHIQKRNSIWQEPKKREAPAKAGE